MNKKKLALVLGLVLNIVPACCADEAQTPVQEPTAQVCTETVCPVTEVTPAPEATTTEPVQAPEVVPATAPVATDVQPEEELTEDQLKELLDQIMAEMQKEEEAKKKKQKDEAATQVDAQAAVAQ